VFIIYSKKKPVKCAACGKLFFTYKKKIPVAQEKPRSGWF